MNERNSTEGVALHRIEFTFNKKEMKAGKWVKKEMNSENLGNDYHHDIRKSSMENTDRELYEIIKEEFLSLPDQTTKEKLMVLANKQLQDNYEENTPVSISLWDLGGQDEFISTNHLFINIEATILIVMDIAKGLYELIGSTFQFGYLNRAVDVLHYWLKYFYNAFQERKEELNIALVLTQKMSSFQWETEINI